MAVTEKTFSVANISIRASADTVEKRLSALPGVRSVSVSLKDMTMAVSFDDELTDEARIVQEVRRCGYNAYTREIPAITLPEEELPPFFTHELRLCALLTALPLLFCIPGFAPWLALIPAAAVIFFCRGILPLALEEIRTLHISDYTISLLSSASALVYAADMAVREEQAAGFFACAGAAVLFFALVRWKLVERERISSKSSADALRASLPSVASVYEHHTEKQTDTQALKEDQIVLIRPSETVPADGRVTRGFALVNESALSGSEVPVEKNEGSYVFAGSICLSGSLEIRVERTGSHTAMMRFADLAEKTGTDRSFQSPFKSFGRYLPVYTGLTAMLCAFGWYFVGRGLDQAVMIFVSVLACASLQALALSSETALIKAARFAASRHILFRSVQALELAGKCDNVVMDQNGTLTDPELTVTDFIPASGMSAGRLEYIAYALESRSEKPFGRAVSRYLRTRKISAVDVREFASLNTRGRSKASFAGAFVCGSLPEMESRGIDSGTWRMKAAQLQDEGKRVRLYAENDEIAGLIAARKNILPGAKEAVSSLKERGCEVILFTDGTKQEAEKLCELAGIENSIHMPSGEETSQLLFHLDSPESVTAYIVPSLPEHELQGADILTLIGTGSDPGTREADLQLTRNRLQDFLTAMDVSLALTEKIQKLQIFVIAYHAFMIIASGFLFPALTHHALPGFLSAAASAYVLYDILQRCEKES